MHAKVCLFGIVSFSKFIKQAGLKPQAGWFWTLVYVEGCEGQKPHDCMNTNGFYLYLVLLWFSFLQLTIIFNNFKECVDQKMYSAEAGMLPAAFADGSTNGGRDRRGGNTLRVVEKVPGQHVEIQAKYIGTTIVVRQVAQYLTFAVRMPEEVVTTIEEADNQDLYLCLHGCPASQRIDLESFRARVEKSHVAAQARNGFTYQSAKAKCKERLPVEDLYFQSCVFDLLSSGDINFTMAAYYAFEDVKILHSNSHQFHIFEKETLLGNGAAERVLNLFSLFLKNILAAFLCTKVASCFEVFRIIGVL